MASSNSDADIRLKATLDAGEVQTELQKIGQDATTSLDGAARSADGLASSMGKVAEKTKLSTQQIVSLGVSMAGMGLKLGASVLESRGRGTQARYLETAGSLAMQGAQTGSMIGGPWGAVAGAAAGAGAGLGIAHFDNITDANKREQALQELGAANASALDKFHAFRDAANESSQFYSRLSDETLTAADRQQMLTQRMIAFERQAEALLGTLRSEDLQRDGKQFADTMRDYAEVLKEVDKAAGAARMLGKDAGKDKPAGSAMSRLGDFDALQKMGITVGGGSGVMATIATLQEQGNSIMANQLLELQTFNRRGVSPATYA